MEGAVQHYFTRGLAPSTHKTYSSDINKFNQFAHNLALPILCLYHNIYCYFVAYLASAGLSPATVKTYLAAVRHLQIAKGLPDPHQMESMAKLCLVERGVDKEYRHPTRLRLPLTPPILRRIRTLWSEQATDPDIIMLWAASCLCFFGFFRMGEITTPSNAAFDPTIHLSVQDVAIHSVNDPRLLRVHLKQSKTDQLREGIDIFVARTDNDLSPVAAMLAYLAIRGAAPGPLFKFADGSVLSRGHFVLHIRDALKRLGLDSSVYSGHSFRIGAATTAAERGIPDSTIQALGRWKSASFLRYIRTHRQGLAPHTLTLARPRED